MNNATDEKAIIDYMKGWTNAFVSGKEIARKVGGRKRYEEDRGWAIHILAQMVRRGILVTDHLGYYKLKLEEKKNRNRRHFSPQMLNILKSSGQSFDGVIIELEDDDQELSSYVKSLPPSKG